MLSPTDARYFNAVKRYAPVIFFHSKEKYMPSSFDYIAPYVNVVGDSLPLRDQLKYPSERYSWFSGEPNAPCYAIVVLGDVATYTIYFYYFYPYNLGKKVAGIEFGNHPGDWEYVSIAFDNDVPISLGWASHGNDKTAMWKDATVSMNGEHPVFFAANGSHGLYNTAGNHYYISKYVRFIYDACDAGKRTETWQNFVLITPDNYNGKKDFTINQDLVSVSLNLPGIDNWTTFRRFGQMATMQTITLFGKSIYRLSGYNTIPTYRFKTVSGLSN